MTSVLTPDGKTVESELRMEQKIDIIECIKKEKKLTNPIAPYLHDKIWLIEVSLMEIVN